MRDTEAEWAALLRAANAGDGRAYARFLHEVAPCLRGIIRARGRALPAHLHEDVLQEVLLAINAKRHTWDPSRPLRPWLFAVARFKVADAFRSRSAEVLLDIADFAELLPADPGPDPTASADAHRLLGHLDLRSAEIVRRVGMEDEGAADAGRRLGMTEGAVRVALHRAMQRLSALAQGAAR